MTKHSDEFIHKLNFSSRVPHIEFRDEFSNGNPRVKAILMCSMIDLKLTSILRLHFAHDKKIAEEMFLGYAPLSTLSAKIKMAYLLKLIPKELYLDIEILRKIRNHFAHEVGNCSLDEKNIASLIGNVQLFKERFKLSDKLDVGVISKPNATAFILLCVFVETQLSRILTVKNDPEKVKEMVTYNYLIGDLLNRELKDEENKGRSTFFQLYDKL